MLLVKKNKKLVSPGVKVPIRVISGIDVTATSTLPWRKTRAGATLRHQRSPHLLFTSQFHPTGEVVIIAMGTVWFLRFIMRRKRTNQSVQDTFTNSRITPHPLSPNISSSPFQVHWRARINVLFIFFRWGMNFTRTAIYHFSLHAMFLVIQASSCSLVFQAGWHQNMTRNKVDKQ